MVGNGGQSRSFASLWTLRPAIAYIANVRHKYMRKILPGPASDFFAVLQQLSLGESDATWTAHCIVMAKLCVIISVGLGLLFALGIAFGFGVEITPLKLISVTSVLIVFPILMGFVLGTAVFLGNRGRRFLTKPFQHENSKGEQAAPSDDDKPSE